MPSNRAAFLKADKATPLSIEPALYTTPKGQEIVVKNGAVAVNPVDWAVQAMGKDLFPFLQYPTISGSDLAGEVVEVGKEVARFKPGDRVVALALGSASKDNNVTQSAFQQYTICLETLACAIPSSMAYEQACVLPLALCTAACGLFQKDYLNLQHPTLDPIPTGKIVLIWGGASSVGCCAIQLARCAGYEVFTTCSPRNFDYVKSLGASVVFDYNSQTVVEDIQAAFQGKECVGAEAISIGSLKPCVKVLEKLNNARKFIASAMPLDDEISRDTGANTAEVAPGVGAKFIWATEVMNNEVGTMIWIDFLPKALAEGKFITAPESLIVGNGLEMIQEAYEVQKKGVSAKKIVVSL